MYVVEIRIQCSECKEVCGEFYPTKAKALNEVINDGWVKIGSKIKCVECVEENKIKELNND